MAPDFQLILTDVDGCLCPGEAQPCSLRVLERLARLNQRARQGEPVPAVTLCTGRPAAYVDAMMQTIAGFLPAIFENGAGLYFPAEYRFAWNPALPDGASQTIRRVRELLEQRVIQTGVGYLQPGKEMSLTLYAMPGYTLATVGNLAQEALAGRDLPVTVDVSVSCVDIALGGVDKGAGARWLAQMTGIPLDSTVGVGDAGSDLAFLRVVGFSAAPANAVATVRAYVDYVSAFKNGRGLLDVVGRVVDGWK